MAYSNPSTSQLARGSPYPWISLSNSQCLTITTQYGSFVIDSHDMLILSPVKRLSQLLTLPGYSLIESFAYMVSQTLSSPTVAPFSYLNSGPNSLPYSKSTLAHQQRIIRRLTV